MTLAIEHVAPTLLRPAPYNPRAMDEESRKRLERGIKEFGLVDPIIARRSDGMVIGGHQRLISAKTLGLESVPVVYLDGIDDDRAAALNVLLNNPGAQGEWDMPKLTDLLSELDAHGFDATLTGFDLKELENLLAPPGGLVDGADVDDVPDTPTHATTVLGDRITLGRHTLVCGDSTDAGVWDVLLAGRQAGMLWTDPPYGVSYGEKNAMLNRTQGRGSQSDSSRIETPIDNDSLSADELQDFLRGALSLAWTHTRDGGAWYVAAPGGPLQLHFAIVLAEMKLWRQLLTWAKDGFVLGRSDYHYRHESLFYGWKEGAAHTWNGGRSQDTVLEFPRPRANKEHPTMKPVALIQRCIENSSQPSDLIVDPFGGSGSTLIAAEACGRPAALIELSPSYCDVIVSRWEKATGQKAVRPS